MAIRIPNSRVRRLTEYVTEPYNPTVDRNKLVIAIEVTIYSALFDEPTTQDEKNSSIVRTSKIGILGSMSRTTSRSVAVILAASPYDSVMRILCRLKCCESGR